MKRCRLLLESIMGRLQRVRGVQVEMSESPAGGFPIIIVKVNRTKVGHSASEVLQRLKDGDPPIYVFAPRVFTTDEFIIDARSLNEEQTDIVAERLYAAVTT